MNNNVLAVAFKGQLYKNEATTTNYVYPESNKDWSMLLGSDPRQTISDLNINGGDCYTIKVTNRGIIYSYRRVLAGRSGSNCAMIMLLVEAPTCDGKMLAEKLKELLKYAMDQTSADQINQSVLNEKMASLEELFYRNRKFTVSLNDETSESSTTNEAYFIYRSEEELFKRLESPYQSTYKNFSCIHFVSVEFNACPSASSNLKLIETPLEKTYFFKFPQGVSEKNGKLFVNENENFTLVYRKPGYIEVPVNLQLNGRSQRYFSIEDDDVVSVYSAEDCRVEFKRQITLTVVDDQSIPIKNWTWKRNNVYGEVKDGMCIWELPDGEYKCKIEANGFESSDYNLDTRKKQVHEVKLKSSGSSQKVYLEPLWAKKDKTNSSYQEKPITISYTKNSLFYRQFSEQLEDRNGYPTFYISRKRPMATMVFIGILALFMGVAVEYCVSHFLIGKKTTVTYNGKEYKFKGTLIKIESTNPLRVKDEDGNDVVEIHSDQGPVTNTNTGEQAVGTITPTVQELEEHDIKYLNKNDNWMFDSLKSKKYSEFYEKVVFNRINYKDVNWVDYNTIINKNWVTISGAIQEELNKGNTTYKNERGLLYYKMMTKAKDSGQTKSFDVKLAATYLQQGPVMPN